MCLVVHPPVWGLSSRPPPPFQSAGQHDPTKRKRAPKAELSALGVDRKMQHTIERRADAAAVVAISDLIESDGRPLRCWSYWCPFRLRSCGFDVMTPLVDNEPSAPELMCVVLKPGIFQDFNGCAQLRQRVPSVAGHSLQGYILGLSKLPTLHCNLPKRTTPRH